MALAFEVAGYQIQPKSLLPLVQVRVRCTNQTGKQFVTGSAICDFYLSRTDQHITQATAMPNEYVPMGGSFEILFNLNFTQEILYRLDKLIASQEDVRFTLHPDLQMFYVDQQSKVETVTHYAGECRLDIKMSDWAKIAYDWGKEMVLVPMSPKTHEQLKELLKTNKHLKSVDELLNELMSLHANRS